MSSSNDIGPSSDEIEVSIFGPGIGECIVAHLGDGHWIVVDSCLEAGRPVSLRYLNSLGVDPANIRDVIVTHWHDDHIRGISAVFAEATDASFHCSAALNAEEFRRLVRAGRLPLVDMGTTEFESVLKLRRSRADDRSRPISVGPNWLAERTFVAATRVASVHALSPSSATQTLAKQELAALEPKPGPKRNLVAQKANSLAVVLSIRAVGGSTVLLGSDLEVTRAPDTGWHAVVDAAQRLSLVPSIVLKVAHHGSPTAHDELVWKSLVHADAHAVTTPYQPSRLPSDADRERVLALTGNAYFTASSVGSRPRRRDLQHVIDAAVKRRYSAGSTMGHVRLRFQADARSPDDVRVELFGSASRAK